MNSPKADENRAAAMIQPAMQAASDLNRKKDGSQSKDSPFTRQQSLEERKTFLTQFEESYLKFR